MGCRLLEAFPLHSAWIPLERRATGSCLFVLVESYQTLIENGIANATFRMARTALELLLERSHLLCSGADEAPDV